jgi:cytochrome c5
MHRLVPLLMAAGALALAGCSRHDEANPKPVASAGTATTDTTPAAGAAVTPGANGQVINGNGPAGNANAANTSGTSTAGNTNMSGAGTAGGTAGNPGSTGSTSAAAGTSGTGGTAGANAAGTGSAAAASGSGGAAGAGDLAMGKTVYSQTCVACHGAGVAGAPKFGDKAAWAPRIAKGKATLYDHALHGFQGQAGTMPPRGGSSDTDAQVKAAVDYMVSQAK